MIDQPLGVNCKELRSTFDEKNNIVSDEVKHEFALFNKNYGPGIKVVLDGDLNKRVLKQGHFACFCD